MNGDNLRFVAPPQWEKRKDDLIFKGRFDDDVLKGEFVLGRQVIPFLIQLVQQVREVTRESRLTAREEEILACLFQGMPDKEIASTLGIGTATVHTHMSRLFEKLDVHSRREIVAKYLAFN